MAKKKSKPKSKKFIVSLSEREVQRLGLYAHDKGLSRPIALKRIVSSTLREYKSEACSAVADNQLGLFDAVQIDIFNNASKVVAE